MTSLAAREMVREKRYEKKPIKAPSNFKLKEKTQIQPKLYCESTDRNPHERNETLNEIM